MEHFLKDVEKLTLEDITSVAQRLLSSPLTMASYGDGKTSSIEQQNRSTYTPFLFDMLTVTVSCSHKCAKLRSGQQKISLELRSSHCS